jgi:hypothetical protein
VYIKNDFVKTQKNLNERLLDDLADPQSLLVRYASKVGVFAERAGHSQSLQWPVELVR